MRQQHGIDRVAGDGELLGIAEEVRGDAGPPVDERAPLRTCIAQERVRAPQAPICSICSPKTRSKARRMRRCSLARHRRPSGVESHSLTAVGSLLMGRSCLRGPSQFNAQIATADVSTPCATDDPRVRYGQSLATTAAPAVYAQQQQRARAGAAAIARYVPLAAIGALVSACQSVGPERSDPAPAAAVPPLPCRRQLEPISMPAWNAATPIVEPRLLTRLSVAVRAGEMRPTLPS